MQGERDAERAEVDRREVAEEDARVVEEDVHLRQKRPPRARARAAATPCASASSSSASGSSSGGSPPDACASACASSQSASHGLRGSSGPCRYVPIARPTRQPSKPLSPSLPKPWTTRPRGSAPASSLVRPAWFSNTA